MTEPVSLQDVIDQHPQFARYLYNRPKAPHSSARPELNPVPQEQTNWRDEQQAWRNTAILFDQSHHMPELFVRGPDAARFLNGIGVNSFKGFGPGRAKQFIGCTEEGLMIGDCVLHDHGEDGFELISGAPLLNWIEYQAQAGNYDVAVERDDDTPTNPQGKRRNFRFGMDGPYAGEIFAQAVDGDAPDIKFFRTARVRIAGRNVLALRHGMAGHQGVELSGEYDDGPAVREALLKIGRPLGLKEGGAKAYFSATGESGWLAYPLPAIYSDTALRAYREWLPADCWEARMQLAGSFFSDDIAEWYHNPFELGYGGLIKFDHEFVGRAALERMSTEPHRRKVTLVWESAAVPKIYASLFAGGIPYKYLELPNVAYGFPHNDEIRARDGRLIGRSRGGFYSANERAVLSLAVIDEEYACDGTELTLVWGEAAFGSAKSGVERHAQLDVKVTVGPVPYATAVQKMKKATLAP